MSDVLSSCPGRANTQSQPERASLCQCFYINPFVLLSIAFANFSYGVPLRTQYACAILLSRICSAFPRRSILYASFGLLQQCTLTLLLRCSWIMYIGQEGLRNYTFLGSVGFFFSESLQRAIKFSMMQ